MKRALLLAIVLAGALGILLLARHETPVLAFEPPPDAPALAASGANPVNLSYVPLAASPRHSEQFGATQVHGRITRRDDGMPVEGGVVRLRSLDYSTSALSAAEEHARTGSGEVYATRNCRAIRVAEDGSWSVDLPGKCWIYSAEFEPGTLIDDWACDEMGNWTSAVIVRPSRRPSDRPMLLRTAVTINRPLESGALEVSFAAIPSLKVIGIVLDAQSAEPVEGAFVSLDPDSIGFSLPSGPDGGFVLDAVDPSDLHPSDGLLTFRIQAPGHEEAVRRIAWERGQSCIPAFKVVLEPHAR